MMSQKKPVPLSSKEMAADGLTLLETSTTLEFITHSHGVARQPCSQPLFGSKLKFGKSGYVLECLLSNLDHQDPDNKFPQRTPTFQNRLERILGLSKLKPRNIEDQFHASSNYFASTRNILGCNGTGFTPNGHTGLRNWQWRPFRTVNEGYKLAWSCWLK